MDFIKNFALYVEQLKKIVRGSKVQLSSIKPSDWVEQNVIIPGKPFPGPFRYDKTPYTREIVNCLAPDHPARRIAVKKGAQLGFSSGVVYAGLMWLIRNQPGNSLVTVGSPELIKKAMGRIDSFITNSGNRTLIGDQSGRVRSGKTGDTNLMKEFPNGILSIYNADNHKNIRQDDYMYGFLDDLESIKSESEKSGDTIDLLEQRFASYADTQKIFLISTPELALNSNIDYAFSRGDQRYYNVHCPSCHEPIVLKWKHDNGEGGIVWELDNHGHVIKKSVGYVCPKCAGFFKDNRKYKLLNEGLWIPTAKPITDEDYSYHISALYAPVGIYDWYHYTTKYVECHPAGQPRIESKYKSIVNLCWGEGYTPPAESPKATQIMTNIRPYLPGIVPEALSIKHGNGEIIALTLAADIGGHAKGCYKSTEDDGRLDWELLATSESGASYSVDHGSIGTFVNREGEDGSGDRVKWTYRDQRENNIWDELERIINKRYVIDTAEVKYGPDGKPAVFDMPVQIVVIDTGYLDKFVIPFIDKMNNGAIKRCFGVKGLKEHLWLEQGVDVPRFTISSSHKRIYNLRVGMYKDDLATLMSLTWDAKKEDSQPFGFMNFPQSEGGKYQLNNFFSHFEAEERRSVKDKKGKIVYRWEKINSAVQNHHLDTRVYNYAALDILMARLFEREKIKNGTWGTFVELMKS